MLSWLSALKPSPNAHLPYHGILLEHTLKPAQGQQKHLTKPALFRRERLYFIKVYAECTFRKPLSGSSSALEQNTRHLQAAQLARCGCSTPALLRDCPGTCSSMSSNSAPAPASSAAHTPQPTMIKAQLLLFLVPLVWHNHFALPLKIISLSHPFSLYSGCPHEHV